MRQTGGDDVEVNTIHWKGRDVFIIDNSIKTWTSYWLTVQFWDGRRAAFENIEQLLPFAMVISMLSSRS